MAKRALIVAAMLLQSMLWAEDVKLSNVQTFTHPKLKMTVVQGECKLPDGNWRLDREGLENKLSAIRFVTHRGREFHGRRLQLYRLERNIEAIHWQVRRLTSEARGYARKNNGIGPKSIRDLAAGTKYLEEKWFTQNPWAKEFPDDVGPFLVMLPEVKIKDSKAPIVIELRPYSNDGKHYVGYADGRVARVKIDAALMRRLKLTIRPMREAAAVAQRPDEFKRQFHALVVPGTKGTVRIPVSKDGKKTDTALVLDLGTAGAGDKKVFTAWAQGRIRTWARQSEHAPTSIVANWSRIAPSVYLGAPVKGREGRNRGDRQTSIFGVLGGRAAIRETLQMQLLAGTGLDRGEREIPVDQIKGVEVKSHPFEKMLGEKPGGNLPMADCVPVDRFMIYFAKPEHLATYLGKGSKFTFQSSSVATRSSLVYDLQKKYSGRLGLGTGWSKLVLESQAVKEIVVMTPDLFLIDGTDITIAMRVPKLQLLQPALRVIGVSGLDRGTVVEKKLPEGGASYWVSHKDMLIVSTRKSELIRSLMLLRNGGKGSLGRSAEFRYMLTKLPVEKSTWGYAYFSDPFIRRLVGPEVKIAQLRRMRIRGQLEAITAAALLYKHDRHTTKPTLQHMAKLGYLPFPLDLDDVNLAEDLVVSSETYGRPGKLATLLENRVDKVTQAEQNAYKTYLQNYTRFWRQFFDPIAIRLNSPTPGAFDLEVFILPLLNSQMYDAVKAYVTPHGKGSELRMPQMKPQPVLTLSANISDKAWIQMVEGLGEMSEAINLDTRILDELGPSVHFSIMDADPVISLGSGDILGAFRGGGRIFGMGAEEMMMVPVFLSALTRPCKIAVELRKPERALKYLRAAGKGTYRIDREFSVSFARVPKKDAWVSTFDIAGILKLRFGVEVKGGFLIVSNIPWARTDSIKTVPGVLDSAALQIAPGAGIRQLPGLYTAAVEAERSATFASAAYLRPLMLAGAQTPAKASEWHYHLLGFAPTVAAAGDAFTWTDNRLVSKRYGHRFDPLYPEHVPGNRDFGMLRVIDKMTLSAQLEEDGLRTRCRWTMIQPKKP